MSISPFVSSPATGDSFIGRKGLVKNLRDRVASGESVAVIGGPKLGKTSLVRTALDRLVDRMVIYVDLGTDPSPRLSEVPGVIVVLDNLDNLADSAIEPLLARVAGAASIVVTGGRRLRTSAGGRRPAPSGRRGGVRPWGGYARTRRCRGSARSGSR